MSAFEVALEKIGTARLLIRAKTPYLRSMLLTLVPHEVKGLGTIGVSKSAILLIDAEVVSTWSIDDLAGALVHEIMHLLGKHHDRLGVRNPVVWNFAGDYAINPAVKEMGYTIPLGGGLDPKKEGWKEGLTADEYYELIMAKLEQQGGAKKPGEGDPSGDGAEGQGGPSKGKGPGSGNCGSCSGHAHDGEPEESEGKTQAQIERASRATAEAINEAASKGRGTVPAYLSRWAEGFLRPAKVPWRKKLAYAMRTRVQFRAGANVSRYDGPSRRQAGIGFGPGKPILPRHRQSIPRVAVVVDTSGSMSEADLAIALRETNGVLKALGAQVTFASCDSEVGGLGTISRIEDAMKLMKGGGGTDFRPPLIALAKQRPAPELVIFCTDGDGPAPEREPPGMRVIWLLVGSYKRRPCAWGEHIEMDD